MDPPQDKCSLFPSKPATKRFHGMRASLVVKGEGPLEVHKMREGNRTVSGSVLGEADKDFEVILWDGRHATRKAIEVKLHFGDEAIACEWMPLQEAKNMVACEENDEVRFWRWSSLRVDDYHVRRFRFAKVAVTDDDDDACNDDDFLINLSNIRIEVRRINPASAGDGEHTSMRNAMEYDPLGYTDERRLHERSDKASFAMSASFGDLVEDELPDSAVGGGVSSFSYNYVDEDKVDLSFEFKICSAAAIDQLLAEAPLALPRTIDDAEGVVRIVDSDDEDEMAEYREAENRAYEAEQEDSDTDVEAEEDEDDPAPLCHARLCRRISRRNPSPSSTSPETPLFSNSSSTSPTTRRHHGIKAFLTVDGEAREVYDMKEYEGRVEGCVLGEAGKKFEVVLYEGRDWKGPKSGSMVRIFFGGHRVVSSKYSLEWSQRIREAPVDSLDRYRAYSSIRIDDVGHGRPFCCGKIPTTEDDAAACASTDDVDSISVIKVEYWRVAAMAVNEEDEEVKPHKAQAETKPPEHGSMDPLDYDDGVRINEQGDKAAFALNASFGDVFLQKKRKKEGDDDRGSKPHKRRKWQNLDNEPSLVFIFKIRSQVWVDNFLASQQQSRTPCPPPKIVSIGKTLYLDEDEAKADAAASSSKKKMPHKAQVAVEPEADLKGEGSGTEQVASTSSAPQHSKDKKKEIRPSALTFGDHISPAPQFARLASRLAKSQVNTTYSGVLAPPSSFGPAFAGASTTFSTSAPTSRRLFALKASPPFPRPPPTFHPRHATIPSTFSLPTPTAPIVEEDSYTPPPHLPHPVYESQASQQRPSPPRAQQQQKKKEEMEVLDLLSDDDEEDVPPARPARRGTPFVFSGGDGGR